MMIRWTYAWRLGKSPSWLFEGRHPQKLNTSKICCEKVSVIWNLPCVLHQRWTYICFSPTETPGSSDYLILSRYPSFFFRFTLQTFVRHLSHLPKCQFEARKDWKGSFLQPKAAEMKPFKPNQFFHCLSKAWFHCSNICFWNYKLLFGQTTMG